MKEHSYTAQIEWTGNNGTGTSSYTAYDRTWQTTTNGKEPIQCSNDPLLGGDPTKHNPEDLLLSALASCHMLWFLHLASDHGIIVHEYKDEPEGVGEVAPNGIGRFLRATLQPTITVEPGTDTALADDLHRRVHDYCFIARSVAFPVTCCARYIERSTSR